MYVHNIDPVMFHLGPLEARWYGLVYALSFVLGYIYVRSKIKEMHISEEQMDEMSFIVVAGTILGARLFEVFVWSFPYYYAHPLKIFAIWEGGMSFHGGLIGVILTAYWFCKKYNINQGQMADTLVIPSLVGLMLGRVANFINGEIVGTVTTVPWCVVFPLYDSLCRHPVQLYAAFGRLILVISAFVLMYKLKSWKPGFIFWMAMFWSGVGRLFIDFLREDARFLGLSLGQYLSIAMSLICLFVLYRYYYLDNQKHKHSRKS